MKIRDIIRLIEAEGWRFHSQRGSHRHYKHPLKPGRVTVPGKPGARDAEEYHETSGSKMTKATQYAVVYEKTGTGYGAYAPDLPGCVSTGRTLEEAERNMREAIAFHLDGLREDGDSIPEPTTRVGMLQIESAA